MGITRVITVDHDRWFVQRAGRYWLLYNGPKNEGDYVNEFKSRDALVDYVIEQREIERSSEK